ncbi:MAG TPA: hypothetical protein VFL62_10620 [Bradyrhizobium sp.]|uniref:hypothetical protein n=1 Tax=Bradyrhizobium sp. TaxID=376 RepID=UPI002D804F80|nr:hypothetical protein [Bradyrhizobium sp.]HET7886670.1 hypothetical protein [Bradyrhizobium sp.]
MRAITWLLFLFLSLLTAPPLAVAAYDAEDPRNCNGVGWDDKSPWVIAKVTAKPRVNFVKSPYDDDFKAETCPASTDACRRNAYLVTDDLVFVGAVQGAFTCVNFQSPLAKKQVWATGWLPSAALTQVARMSPTRPEDWIGKWYHPGGPIEITPAKGGKLHVEGGITVPTARDFHNGDFAADVTAAADMLDFVSANDESCHVQMQRIGPWLMVGDNGGCGGAGVTFQGLYRRTK